MPSTTSADEGTSPDGVKKGKASSRQLQLKLGSKTKIATWNVRSMSSGKLQNVAAEAEKNNINILGIAEHKWRGQGHFSTIDDGKMIYSGKEKSGLSGVAIYLRGKLTSALMGYNPISDRILLVCLKGTAQNITIIQVYAPTSALPQEERENFYNILQTEIDNTDKSDQLLVMGDFNSKMGRIVDSNEKGVAGNFRLVERNDCGIRLVEFDMENEMAITNTMFMNYKRRLYTWISPDGDTKNQIDYTLVNGRWRTSVSATRTLPGADCGSDHEMLMCEFKFRLKCFKKSPKPIRYDLQEIPLNFFYKIEIKSRFRALLDTAKETKPNEMALEIIQVYKEAAANHLPKKEITKKPWITKETIEAIEKRKTTKHNWHN